MRKSSHSFSSSPEGHFIPMTGLGYRSIPSAERTNCLTVVTYIPCSVLRHCLTMIVYSTYTTQFKNVRYLRPDGKGIVGAGSLIESTSNIDSLVRRIVTNRFMVSIFANTKIRLSPSPCIRNSVQRTPGRCGR